MWQFADVGRQLDKGGLFAIATIGVFSEAVIRNELLMPFLDNFGFVVLQYHLE